MVRSLPPEIRSEIALLLIGLVLLPSLGTQAEVTLPSPVKLLLKVPLLLMLLPLLLLGLAWRPSKITETLQVELITLTPPLPRQHGHHLPLSNIYF